MRGRGWGGEGEGGEKGDISHVPMLIYVLACSG
jgi:hypothetical protein